MGTTRDDGVPTGDVGGDRGPAAGRGHPFFERLNQILGAAGFDAFVETLCAPFYATMGRPSLAPGRYFRLLLLGYFEGLDSERAIAWRAAESLSLRAFLRLAPPAAPPDHSTISRTRRLLSVETHQAVFTWVLQQLADAGLVRGKTVGIDATTLEANAALRSIVRRDTGRLHGVPGARDAVYANRRRIRGARGRRLLRCRGELLERPFAHLFETVGCGGCIFGGIPTS